MDRRHRKMIEDVVNDTMTAIGDSAARCVMNSIPVPWEDYEETLIDNMVEVMSYILADKLAETVNRIVSPPWYVRLWKWLNTREQ